MQFHVDCCGGALRQRLSLETIRYLAAKTFIARSATGKELELHARLRASEAAVVEEPLYFLRHARVVEELAERSALSVGPRQLLWVDGAERANGFEKLNHGLQGCGGRNTAQDVNSFFPCHCLLDHPSSDRSLFRGKSETPRCLYMGGPRSRADN